MIHRRRPWPRCCPVSGRRPGRGPLARWCPGLCPGVVPAGVPAMVPISQLVPRLAKAATLKRRRLSARRRSIEFRLKPNQCRENVDQMSTRCQLPLREGETCDVEFGYVSTFRLSVGEIPTTIFWGKQRCCLDFSCRRVRQVLYCLEALAIFQLTLAGPHQSLADLVQCRPTLADVVQCLVEIGKTLHRTGRMLVDIGRSWNELHHIWPGIGQCMANVDQLWSKLGQHQFRLTAPQESER